MSKETLIEIDLNKNTKNISFLKNDSNQNITFDEKINAFFENTYNVFTGDQKLINLLKDGTSDVKRNEDFILQTIESKGGYVANERWTIAVTIESKIVNFYPQEVVCECLVDKESETFEIRTFNRDLFSNINIEIGTFVLIKLFSKPGSSRIDVIENKNFIDRSVIELFSLEEGWNDIANEGFEKPIEF